MQTVRQIHLFIPGHVLKVVQRDSLLAKYTDECWPASDLRGCDRPTATEVPHMQTAIQFLQYRKMQL